MTYRIRYFFMAGRELSEYGLPQSQTVDNDIFTMVYHREAKAKKKFTLSSIYLYSLLISERFTTAIVQ